MGKTTSNHGYYGACCCVSARPSKLLYYNPQTGGLAERKNRNEEVWFGVCPVSLSQTHTHVLTVSPLGLWSKFTWFVLAYANQGGSNITNPQRWGSPPPSHYIQPEHSDDQPSHQADSCQREPNTDGSGHIKALRCVFLVVWWYDQIRHLFFPWATPRLFPESEWRCRGGGCQGEYSVGGGG